MDYFQPFYTEIEGLFSQAELKKHLDLYDSYVDELNGRLATCPHSDAFLEGAVRLHETFFAQLTDEFRPLPEGDLFDAMTYAFGSVDAWWDATRSKSLCSRGWVVLAVDKSAELTIESLDSHEEGGGQPWTPLVAIDCYEHAYWTRFGANRAKYVDVLGTYIDWGYVQGQFRKLTEGVSKKRKGKRFPRN